MVIKNLMLEFLKVHFLILMTVLIFPIKGRFVQTFSQLPDIHSLRYTNSHGPFKIVKFSTIFPRNSSFCIPLIEK